MLNDQLFTEFESDILGKELSSLLMIRSKNIFLGIILFFILAIVFVLCRMEIQHYVILIFPVVWILYWYINVGNKVKAIEDDISSGGKEVLGAIVTNYTEPNLTLDTGHKFNLFLNYDEETGRLEKGNKVQIEFTSKSLFILKLRKQSDTN